MFSLVRPIRYFRNPRRNLVLKLPTSFHVRLKSSSKIPSLEQQAIVEALKYSNVIVSARPGSGKTATAKAVVAANPDSPTLILTYSKTLQEDTKKQLERHDNADIYTFHSFAGNFFGGEIIKDDYRLHQLRAQTPPPTQVSPYEFIILDEVQDMTGILYWLTCMLMSSVSSLPSPPKLLLLGDPRQAIYGYQGADARYLELGKELLSDYSPYPWQKLELAKSYRMSHENASFVNASVEESYIEGSHGGPKPIYIRYNRRDCDLLAKKIHTIIKKYPANNCAIIAPSVRNNDPLAKVTNHLSEDLGLPVAEPRSDDSPLDPLVLEGKLAVSTYHQFKGSEREVVIVFGVDASYFRYYGRNLPHDQCPNAIFVALTRAKKQLVIIQDYKEPEAPFLQWEKVVETCRIIDVGLRRPIRSSQNRARLPIMVTNLVRHVPTEKMGQLIEEYVDYKEVASSSGRIRIPGVVSTNRKEGWYESVSDLTGVAILAAFEQAISGGCSLQSTTSVPINKSPQPRQFAELATRYSARFSGYRSRLGQLDQFKAYGWLGKHLRETTDRLKKQFNHPSLLSFELYLESKPINDPAAFKSVCIAGQLDIMENSLIEGESPTIWEIKFVSSLSLEHVAQVVLYGYLWVERESEKSQGEVKFPRLVLFNVRDGTKWEISTTFDKAASFARELLRVRERVEEPISDEVFLEKCRQVREEVARAGTGLTSSDMDGIRQNV